MYRFGLALLTLLTTAPVAAQDRETPDLPTIAQDRPPVFSSNGQVWRTGDAGSGQTGQRQTREQVARNTGIEPMAQIGGRIQNRAQTRIRNRIDRYYDPQANSTSPFVVASDQARTVGRRPR